MARNIPPFSRNRTTNFDLEAIVRSLGKLDILHGRFYEVELEEGVETRIFTGGFKGWIVVDKDGEGDVWRVNESDARRFTLTSNANLKIRIWVF